jgi:glucan 1,3-beta-glucosidase
LDLHGAPGSQNGKDHSGRIGKPQWRKGNNVEHSLEVLESLAKRYKKSKALIGIELLNEPAWKLGKRRLTKFYKQAYNRIRKHCDESVAIVFPDAFKPKRWRRTLRGKRYKNVMIDVHHYQLFNWFDRRRGSVSHMKKVFRLRRLIKNLQRVRPVIIGEWSAALPAKAYEGIGKAELQRAYASAQIAAMDNAKGWFYWNYKTEGGGPWSYRECVERAILPLAKK